MQNAGNRALDSISSQAPKLAADGALGARLEGQFVGIDPNSALHVALDVHAGNVKMTGKVANAATRAKYVAAARATSGVRSVDAHLAIDPALGTPRRTVRDFALAATVRANLAAQFGGNGLGLGVTANEGTVTVSGNAQNAGVKSAMLDAVRKTGGVRTIVDRIRVRS